MAAPPLRSEPLSVNTQLKENFNVGSRFTELRPIGYGANGIVFAGTDSDCDKQVAVKKISFHDQTSCKFALREIKIMKGLEHENVVKVHECLGFGGSPLDTVDPRDLHAVYIVQELLDTDLHCLIQSGQLTEQHIQLFLYQLLRGLKYLHSANVLHRDLKPSNLLVNFDDLTLKIADFGLSRIVDPNYNHKGFLTENLGTTWYRSPEHVISPKDYESSVDIWSAGCVFAEMLLGRPLFPGAHEINQLHLILDTIELEECDWSHVLQSLPNKLLKNHPLRVRTPLRDRLPDVNLLGIDLLERLLRFNPADRLTAEEALTHPYLSDLHAASDEPIVAEPFLIEHEVDDLSPSCIKEMIVAEVTSECSTGCGSQVSTQPALPSKIVNKNLRNQLIHNQVTWERTNVAKDRSHSPIITQSKMNNNQFEADKNIPKEAKVLSVSLGDSNEYEIEEVSDDTSNECQNEESPISSADCEKEMYQSMLEHLNKLNMAKSLIESPKKKKIEPPKKKEVEKYYDDEKDTAEYSTRKYEEDQEIISTRNKLNDVISCNKQCDQNIYELGNYKQSAACTEPLLIEDFIFQRTNTVLDFGLSTQGKPRNKDELKSFKMGIESVTESGDFYKGRPKVPCIDNIKMHDSSFESTLSRKNLEFLNIDVEEIENFKEFSQLSPKEVTEVNNSELNDEIDWKYYENWENTASVSISSAKKIHTEVEQNNVYQRAPLEVNGTIPNKQLNASITENCAPENKFPSKADSSDDTGDNHVSDVESDQDSIFSSDSNKFQESHNLSNSRAFSSNEKLKEICDSENQRSKTPGEQTPPHTEVVRILDQKRLKEMANIGVPSISSSEEGVTDKNDKNKAAFRDEDVDTRVISQGNEESALLHSPGLPPGRKKSINLHQLRQEINERLKCEESQARSGELAAGGGWNAVTMDTQQQGHKKAFSQENKMVRRREIIKNKSSNTPLVGQQTRQHEYSLPQPRWPCGEINSDSLATQSSTSSLNCNEANINTDNVTNNEYVMSNREQQQYRPWNRRPTRKKVSKKTKAL